MEITFYGVRGSMPTPGADYIKYGGNTACVHVMLSDGTDIVLDSGTGISTLGRVLAAKETDIHLLLSHNHWDHIQGFPFFVPIYQANRNIKITPGLTSENAHDAILQQMSGSYFPVCHTTLASNISFEHTDKTHHQWKIGQATITRLSINHPGAGSAYTIEENGAKLAYITDNELYPPYKKETDFQEFAEFAKGSDLIIHDAQYMLSDMPAKSGWGHSVAEETVKLALASQSKQLALYSHDPSRTDKDIEEIEQHCQEVIEIAQMDINLFAAKEGMVINL